MRFAWEVKAVEAVMHSRNSFKLSFSSFAAMPRSWFCSHASWPLSPHSASSPLSYILASCCFLQLYYAFLCLVAYSLCPSGRGNTTVQWVILSHLQILEHFWISYWDSRLTQLLHTQSFNEKNSTNITAISSPLDN